MSNWTLQSGYPVLNIIKNTTSNTFSVTQVNTIPIIIISFYMSTFGPKGEEKWYSSPQAPTEQNWLAMN